MGWGNSGLQRLRYYLMALLFLNVVAFSWSKVPCFDIFPKIRFREHFQAIGIFSKSKKSRAFDLEKYKVHIETYKNDFLKGVQDFDELSQPQSIEKNAAFFRVVLAKIFPKDFRGATGGLSPAQLQTIGTYLKKAHLEGGLTEAQTQRLLAKIVDTLEPNPLTFKRMLGFGPKNSAGLLSDYKSYLARQIFLKKGLVESFDQLGIIRSAKIREALKGDGRIGRKLIGQLTNLIWHGVNLTRLLNLKAPLYMARTNVTEIVNRKDIEKLAQSIYKNGMKASRGDFEKILDKLDKSGNVDFAMNYVGKAWNIVGFPIYAYLEMTHENEEKVKEEGKEINGAMEFVSKVADTDDADILDDFIYYAASLSPNGELDPRDPELLKEFSIRMQHPVQATEAKQIIESFVERFNSGLIDIDSLKSGEK